jgi:hypothetical protein
MKKFTILLAMMLFGLAAIAQQAEPADPPPDPDARANFVLLPFVMALLIYSFAKWRQIRKAGKKDATIIPMDERAAEKQDAGDEYWRTIHYPPAGRQ